jgi:hypothetical protein
MRKPRAVCYPSGPVPARGCYPPPPDTDGCYPSPPPGSDGRHETGTVRDLLLGVLSPRRAPGRSAAPPATPRRGRTRTTGNT